MGRGCEEVRDEGPVPQQRLPNRVNVHGVRHALFSLTVLCTWDKWNMVRKLYIYVRYTLYI